MSEAELPPEPPKPDLEPAREAASKPRLKVVPAAPLTAAQTPRRTPSRRPMAPVSISPGFPENLAVMIEQGGLALSAILQPQTDQSPSSFSASVVDAVQAFGRIAEYWLADPQRAFEAHNAIWSNFLALWTQTLRRLSGETDAPSCRWRSG